MNELNSKRNEIICYTNDNNNNNDYSTNKDKDCIIALRKQIKEQTYELCQLKEQITDQHISIETDRGTWMKQKLQFATECENQIKMWKEIAHEMAVECQKLTFKLEHYVTRNKQLEQDLQDLIHYPCETITTQEEEKKEDKKEKEQNKKEKDEEDIHEIEDINYEKELTHAIDMLRTFESDNFQLRLQVAKLTDKLNRLQDDIRMDCSESLKALGLGTPPPTPTPPCPILGPQQHQHQQQPSPLILPSPMQAASLKTRPLKLQEIAKKNQLLDLVIRRIEVNISYKAKKTKSTQVNGDFLEQQIEQLETWLTENISKTIHECLNNL